MKEELMRWLAEAKPAAPWALVVGGAFLLGLVVMRWLARRKVAEAKRALEFADEQLMYVDCIAEPTGELDVSQLFEDNGLRARLDRGVERVKAAFDRADDGPDWTPEELDAVKRMTDRTRWPNTPAPEPEPEPEPEPYRGRGQRPRLRPWWHEQVTGINPKVVGDRITRIRAEQELTVRHS